MFVSEVTGNSNIKDKVNLRLTEKAGNESVVSIFLKIPNETRIKETCSCIWACLFFVKIKIP